MAWGACLSRARPARVAGVKAVCVSGVEAVCVPLGWSSRPERGRFAGNADRGSDIDEQRAGTVHRTRDED
jgi:hypothetical protein